MERIVLNVDAGELPDEPEELYALAHLVNVACGGHAGDDASMDRVLAFCKQFGTRAGAHPSYADREGFGRRAVAIEPDSLEALVHDQCARLAARGAAIGVRIATMKPHGALYHAANRDEGLARAVVHGAKRALGDDVAIVGPPHGALARASTVAGCAFMRERFCDRGVLPDGSLVPRGEPGALVTDAGVAAARAAAYAVAADAETVCVHGDTPGAVAIARAVRRVLDVVAPVAPFGDDAYRWAIAETADRAALLAALRALPGVVDAIVTESFACVVGAPPDFAALASGSGEAPAPRDHVVPVRYDGADLAEVAERAETTVDDVIARHLARTYTVRLVGFLPGFAYLREVDPRIALPRRATPRTRVPAGAVGVAAGYTGVYPFASPGGWNLLGTAVDFSPFDPIAGARLALGDRVRFERVR